MIYRAKRYLRNLSYKYGFFKRVYLLANIFKVRVFSIVSDATYARIKYKENTGKSLDLKSPTTFNEKLWWLKLNNRDPLLTKCSDKVAVREYVKECGLEHILNEVYGVYSDARQIDFSKLPDKAFIKTNHTSGINIIWDRNKPFNRRKFVKVFNRALKRNYYFQSREWNYKNIPPKLIVEKFLEDEQNGMLVDYRFLCFDGIVNLVFVDIETAAEDGAHNPFARRNVYDRDFNYLNIKAHREHFDKSLISKPRNFDKMIEYAERLSQPFPFCRVDLYNINGHVYFGEMTFYPGGATQIVEPPEWEKRMGDWIDLKSEKIKLRKGAKLKQVL